MVASLLFVWAANRKIGKYTFLCRSLLIFAILSPLAGPYRYNHSDIQSIFVLFDVSDSVLYLHKRLGVDVLPVYRRELAKLAQQLLPQDRLGVSFFADGVEVVRPLTTVDPGWQLPAPQIRGGATKIETAVTRALQMLAAEPERTRLIVFSDGAMVDTQALSRLRTSFPTEVEYRFQLWTDAPFRDLAIESISLPLIADEGDYLQGEIMVYSSHPANFTLICKSDRHEISSRTIHVPQKGSYRFSFPLEITATSQQVVSVEARMATADICEQNNFHSTVIRVRGKRKILAIGNELSLPGMDIEHRSASDLQVSDFDIHSYAAIVIAGADARELSPFLQSIERYVFAGGGLLMLGDHKTFGSGGYGGTAVEKALPVWCTSQTRKPIAWVVVLDRSGSMARSWRSKAKIDLAKQAIGRVVAQMQENDAIALISFHEESRREIALASVAKNKLLLAEQLRALVATGKTSITPALRMAFDELRAQSGYVRHILLISDGLSTEPGDLAELAGQIAAEGISLSVVATGEKSPLLERIALRAKGRYYDENDLIATSLLQDFQALRGPVVDEKEAAITAIDQELRSCHGLKIQRHLLTSGKEWVQVLLKTERGTPLIARGYYGLGRSMAITTNFSPSWGGQLSQYSQILVPAVSWLTIPSSQELTIEAKQRQTLQIAMRAKKDLLGPYEISTTWLEDSYPMREMRPGQYESSLPTPPQGKHQIAISANTQQQLVVEYVQPYPREYIRLGAFPMARTDYTPTSSRRHEDLAWIFLSLAILLFFVDQIVLTNRLR